ncbi:putative D-aminoacylase [Pyronema omphalodes]|nr:putative D-aminoacylase [Pyronema omphalodes]
MRVGTLEALGPLIVQICKIAGTPGMSLGVLHDGEIHQAHFGFRDIASGLPPDETTTYVIGSLTKAVTAAMFGILVEDGKLDWTTQLHDILPEYTRNDKDPAINITIEDILSHRTGLPGYDSLWLGSNNNPILKRSDAVPILSYLPVAKPLRTEFIYNNMAYEVAGQVIEKVSGLKYTDFLREHIVEPLAMLDTVYTDAPVDANTASKAYSTLRDGSAHEIPLPLVGEDILMGAAGGIRSSITDLLIFYENMMHAANIEFDGGDELPGNPFKQLRRLWKGMISIPCESIRECSYAMGWVRTELPTVMGCTGPDGMPGICPPMIGKGLPSRLALIHQGSVAGSVAFVALFPETTTAIVVMANSVGLTDSVKLVGQLLIETTFENGIEGEEFLEYARKTAESGATYLEEVQRELKEGKNIDKPPNPLKAYVGRYYNAIGNYWIEVVVKDDALKVSFMGSEEEESFDLEPYQGDAFFWITSHDQEAKKARSTTFGKDYYILKFGCKKRSLMIGTVDMGCVAWKHDSTVDGEGEIFRKTKGRTGSRIYRAIGLGQDL